MLTIALRFPAGGRYHATAWGSHANEGVPEWPPSPWRLLRAVIATARWKDSAVSCGELPRLRSLIDALATAPAPRYVLPIAAAAHTRHYMPLGDDSTTKIFDTFVHPAADRQALKNGDATTVPLLILWDATLDAGAREYLALLLGRMGYLGRAESLVDAQLLAAGTATDTVNCRPLAEGEPIGSEEQTFKLLTAQSPAEYSAWIGARSDTSREGGARAKRIEPPADLFAALHLDTDQWRGGGWSQPPGSRWIEYVRPATSFRLASPPARHRRRARSMESPTVARYGIQTPVRESVTKALSFGERFHDALCSRSDSAPAFSGLSEGKRATGHDHAFYLPECDHRGLLTHMTIFARMGFDENAVRALRSLDAMWSRRSPGLKLLLLGIGTGDEFAELPILRAAQEWKSLTPFVPVRHIQRSRSGKPRVDPEIGFIRGSPEHDLRRLLIENGYPAAEVIEPLDALELPGRRIRWANFQRKRRHGEGAAILSHSGYGFRVRFPHRVSGPIAVGYGAHFGLGLFVPERR